MCRQLQQIFGQADQHAHYFKTFDWLCSEGKIQELNSLLCIYLTLLFFLLKVKDIYGIHSWANFLKPGEVIILLNLRARETNAWINVPSGLLS